MFTQFLSFSFRAPSLLPFPLLPRASVCRRRVLFFSLSLVSFPPSHGAGTHLQDAAEPADALPLSCVRFVLLTTEVEWERESAEEVEKLSSPSPPLPPSHQSTQRSAAHGSLQRLSQWHRTKPAIGWCTSAKPLLGYAIVNVSIKVAAVHSPLHHHRHQKKKKHPQFRLPLGLASPTSTNIIMQQGHASRSSVFKGRICLIHRFSWQSLPLIRLS